MSLQSATLKTPVQKLATNQHQLNLLRRQQCQGSKDPPPPRKLKSIQPRQPEQEKVQLPQNRALLPSFPQKHHNQAGKARRQQSALHRTKKRSAHLASLPPRCLLAVATPVHVLGQNCNPLLRLTDK